MSLRAVDGRCASLSSLEFVTADCGVAMVVGSTDPLSLRVGGSREVIVKTVLARELKSRLVDEGAKLGEQTARVRRTGDQVSTRGYDELKRCGLGGILDCASPVLS